jgi:hypothetical protein
LGRYVKQVNLIAAESFCFRATEIQAFAVGFEDVGLAGKNWRAYGGTPRDHAVVVRIIVFKCGFKDRTNIPQKTAGEMFLPGGNGENWRKD